MSEPRHRAKPRPRARVVFATLAVLGVCVSGTTAAWTDSADTSGTTQAGTVDIQLGATAGTESNATLNLLGGAITNVKPTWTLTKTFTVMNKGTIPITVTAASAPTATTSLDGAGAAIAPGDFPTLSLSSQLSASLTCGGQAMYSGKLAGLKFQNPTSFTLAVGARTTCTLTLDAAGLPTSFQGYSDTLSWTLTATGA